MLVSLSWEQGKVHRLVLGPVLQCTTVVDISELAKRDPAIRI